ncbi:MAG: SRPBCC family protein [Pyrinomonadaceae bacterium]
MALGKIENIAAVVAGATVVGYGVRKQSPVIIALGLVGAGALLCRGTLRKLASNTMGLRTSTAEDVARDYHIEKSITINETPEGLYKFWRDLENLPRFIENLESVTPLDERRSHWVVKGPANSTVEWDAEIFNEKENELIAWRSLSGSEVTNAGSVHFEPAPDGRGTKLSVTVNYNPPGGKAGVFLAKLFGEEPGQLIDLNLRRLKRLVETGEIPTIEGQTSGRLQEPEPERKENKFASKTPVKALTRNASEGVA